MSQAIQYALTSNKPATANCSLDILSGEFIALGDARFQAKKERPQVEVQCLCKGVIAMLKVNTTHQKPLARVF